MSALSIFIFSLSHYWRKFYFSLLILNLYHNKIDTFTTSPKSCLPIATWVFNPWSNSASHTYHGVSSRICIVLGLWKCRENQWSIASMLPAIYLVVEKYGWLNPIKLSFGLPIPNGVVQFLSIVSSILRDFELFVFWTSVASSWCYQLTLGGCIVIPPAPLYIWYTLFY